MPSLRFSGGMLVVWNKQTVDVLDTRMGVFSISISCRLVDENFLSLHTGVYGLNDKGILVAFWAELDATRAWVNYPWCIGGDFNLIRYTHEKMGGTQMTRFMNEFADFERRHELVEYPLEGAHFTRSDNRRYPVMTKIDRLRDS
ncbi:hypothetical protein FRX31_034433 [Thalictrum thalictroides]|uniref:Endonuclease/exonuclease/phosphatase domain-containing protein n=1 Tax=Thalictrum thalictroides TaxID=46969 RepID=A0A7J6UU49_THATH|nr:hypothetical protein FRX31_034433 [Thalictrum thalictroides]